MCSTVADSPAGRAASSSGSASRCERDRRHPEHRQHVGGGERGRGARAQQPVGSRGQAREDGAGDGHHLAPLVEREPRRDQGAGALVRLDHDDDVREAGDQAVALREVMRQRRAPRRVLGDERAGRGDLLGEGGVLPGVDPVGAGAPHRDGRPAGGERAAVGGGIDAARHPGDDGDAGRRQLTAEVLRDLAAVGGGAPRADDRRRRHRRHGAAHEDAERRVAEHREARRVRGVVGGDPPPAECGDVALDRDSRRRGRCDLVVDPIGIGEHRASPPPGGTRRRRGGREGRRARAGRRE